MFMLANVWDCLSSWKVISHIVLCFSLFLLLYALVSCYGCCLYLFGISDCHMACPGKLHLEWSIAMIQITMSYHCAMSPWSAILMLHGYWRAESMSCTFILWAWPFIIHAFVLLYLIYCPVSLPVLVYLLFPISFAYLYIFLRLFNLSYATSQVWT